MLRDSRYDASAPADVPVLQQRHTETDQGSGDGGVSIAERFALDAHDLALMLGGGRVVALHVEDIGEVRERHGGARVLRPQPPLTDRESLTMQRLGLGQLRSLPQQDAEQLEARGQSGLSAGSSRRLWVSAWRATSSAVA